MRPSFRRKKKKENARGKEGKRRGRKRNLVPYDLHLYSPICGVIPQREKKSRRKGGEGSGSGP